MDLGKRLVWDDSLGEITVRGSMMQLIKPCSCAVNGLTTTQASIGELGSALHGSHAAYSNSLPKNEEPSVEMT